MTYRGHRTRDQIGLRAPRSRSFNIDPDGLLFHWPGHNVWLGSLAEAESFMRRVQHDHMAGNGWSDFAYSMGTWGGWTFSGRGRGVRTAANGTNAANGTKHAVLVMKGPDEPLDAGDIDGMWAAWNMLGKGHHGVHSDVRPTLCAGPYVERAVRAGPTNPEKESIVADWRYENEAEWARNAGIYSRFTKPGDPVDTDELAVFLHRAHVRGLLDKEPSGPPIDTSGWKYPTEAEYCIRAGIFSRHTKPGDQVTTDHLAVFLERALS